MRRVGQIAGCCGLISLGWLAGQWAPGVVAQSQPTKPPDAASAGIHVEKPEIVAIVNGVPISRQELGEEMIARHGKHQLDLLINRRIIHMAAQRAGITVTDAEVEEDVQEVMKLGKFRTPKEFEDHFLKKEKNCTLYEYKEDVIRPGLMMKKMADKRLQISEEEIRKEFEARYGERVQCCIVYEQDQKVIHSIYAEIIRSDNMVKAFMDAAKKQSNLSLATCAGRVNPIGRNTTSKNVEDRAFLMQDGEISEVLGVPGGFVILMREHPVPADKDKNLDQERATIRREIVDKKMRTEVPKLFQELKKSAQVQDFLNKKFAGSFTDVIEDQASESSASKRNK